MNEPRDILQALFVGDDVDGAAVTRAAEAARGDDEVRALFDKLAVTDRELGGDFEARFGEAWFLESLDTMLAEETADKEDSEKEDNKVVSLDSRRAKFAPMLMAAAAALAVGLGLVGYQNLRTPEPEFQPRSATVDKPRIYEMPSVEVFCVERTDQGVEFVGSEQAELATVRCAVGQEIKLAVRNPDPRLRFAAFLGIADDHTLHWYGPSPASPAAFAAPTTSELKPVGETIRLDVNHEPGTVRVVGVFVEDPLDFLALEKWTATNANALRDGSVEVPRGVMVRQTFEVTQ